MLRPERMSKVSVTGSKAVMASVIETVHDQNLLHVSDYDGSVEGFDNGDPMTGAETASDRLVTVRSLQSILGITEADGGERRIVTEEVEDHLESIRTEVNELDDRRAALRDDLRGVQERIDAVDPFVDLGIDLDLLSGYDSLSVAVGEGDPAAVESALADAESVEAFEVFTGEEVVAAFARPTPDAGEDAVDDALVGVEFARVEVPEGSGSPAEYVADLEAERAAVRDELSEVDSEITAAREEHGAFLLAAEEALAIEVQKTEIPLQFATTGHAFVAEGWLPTDEVADFEAALRDAVGDHVAFDELERAAYTDPHGHATEHEAVAGGEAAAADGGADAPTDDGADGEPGSAAGDGDARADGGTYAIGDADPPTVQENPGPAQPFELLVEMINRPLYWEFDPTVFLLLTFPAFYGFMIGDLGYGLLYTAVGYWLYRSFDGAALRSLGGIAMWAGGFTMLFGVLYGEVFGLHVLGEVVWGGHPPLRKGLAPAEVEWAQAWLVVALVVGIAHVGTGWLLSFLKDLDHGLVEAVMESGSWLLMLFGLWSFVFSRLFEGSKPAFLFEVFNGHPFPLGFAGLSASVGLVGLAAFVVGLVLIAMADLIEAVEAVFLQVMVNVLSYARLTAVLLAKAGMAFVVNLLFFGVYAVPAENGLAEYHFMLSHGSAYVLEHHPEAEILFGGLVHGGVVAVVGGVLVLVLGHLLVLALGVTSAGLQAVRLEYVEFFNKFYEGGGENYEPFGYRRTYTTED